MRLSLQELEPREAPAVDLGGGVLRLSTGHEYQVFPDYAGALVWLTDANGVTTVAPSPNETNRPGGPRVATLDGHGNRTQPDYFAGPPDSRCGVALVDTGGTVTQAPTVHDAPATFGVPDLTYGNPADPANWTIYLDFENPSSSDWTKRTADEAWRIMQPLGNVALVTRRPADFPGNYGVVTIGANLSFTGDQGDTVARWDEPHSNWDSGGVYVDCRDILPGFPVDPVEVGQIAAHEVGHALGLGHDATPGSVMQFGHSAPGMMYTAADAATARANAAKAVALEYHATAAGAG